MSPPTVSSLSVSVTHPNDQHPNNNYTYAYTTIGGTTTTAVVQLSSLPGEVAVGEPNVVPSECPGGKGNAVPAVGSI